MIFEGKRILVTGGTGSMGNTFVRRVLSGSIGTPEKLVVFSRDEGKQHDMRVSYSAGPAASTDEVLYRNFQNVLEFRVGDVRSYADVCSAVRGVDIVVHAAALKQVPTCEYFPDQAVLTNCMGAMNIVRAIREHALSVGSVIAISTDKACKPVNVMGMTKAIQERVLTSGNILNPGTRFICVRYGNVLASRGSVIPLFHEQIRAGGPVTITDERMTRFVLSLEEAVDTVVEALRSALPGETYVPVAPGVRMVHVARALVGQRRIAMKSTGVRPGEKYDEILISEEEVNHTIRRGNYYVVRPMLPELQNGEDNRQRALTKEFSSGDVVLSYEDTVALLRRHRLMLEDTEGVKASELLR